MRTGIEIEVTAADRKALMALIAGRNTPAIRRGTFASVAELEEAIHDYLLRHNAEPKPFVWTKNAESILKRERRALDLLDLIRKGNQPSESEH
jgi:hypothetical protein